MTNEEYQAKKREIKRSHQLNGTEKLQALMQLKKQGFPYSDGLTEDERILRQHGSVKGEEILARKHAGEKEEKEKQQQLANKQAELELLQLRKKGNAMEQAVDSFSKLTRPLNAMEQAQITALTGGDK